LALRVSDATEIWLANTGADPTTVTIAGQGRLTVAVLDADSFAVAARARDHMDNLTNHEGPITLDGYAVVRIRMED
ncbi:MAG: hypothetical protein WA873_10030, partial [Jannaschia helgolandensis]